MIFSHPGDRRNRSTGRRSALRGAASRRRGPRTRRGVVAVLAMMFLIIFGSLSVAMAAVSQGNLRTAETHQRVVRAQGAVDTGMRIARARLSEAAARFIVAKGEITPAYALALWNGTYGGTPTVTVLPPKDGRIELAPATGISEALRNQHDEDDLTNIATDITLGSPPAGWVRGAPIGLEQDPNGRVVTAAQIDYGPPDADGRVLVVVTGYDWDWMRNRWVSRTAQQSFSMTKTLKQAIISPSRVMIGKNVQVEGPLGVRYNSAALDTLDGPPLVSRSDFYGLNSTLDRKLDDFYAAVLSADVDGDNRLRVGHALESAPFPSLNAKDYDNNGSPDAAFADVSGDGALDDFDIFIKHYDTNNDGRLVLSPALTAGTANAGLSAEFTADDALAELIDSGKPDRNGNGRRNGRLVAGAWVFATFPDNNKDGVRDEGDLDLDDVTLGYRDGILDARDRYAKIRGSVAFKANRSAWEASKNEFNVAIGDYQKLVKGPISAEKDKAPVTFQAPDDEIPQITQDSFADAAQTMGEFGSQPGVSSLSFAQQVTNAKGGGWTPPAQIESTPYGSPAPADWYARPVYEGITFRNVVIPMGNNGLFIDCTFVGVTRVRTFVNNTHLSWVFYGEQQRGASGSLEQVYPPPPAESASQLDKSYSTPGAPGYDALPDPLVVSVDLNGDGVANDPVTDTKKLSNNIRFHDCLFIGSIVADKPTVFTHTRNKLQFTGATQFTDQHPDSPNDPTYALSAQEKSVTGKSSMMLPQYSVDIGTNNSPAAQDVNLKGAVIAGVLDVRGNTSIDGVLLLTYQPQYGVAPLSLYGTPVGNPMGFNMTLGYFSSDEGDAEGVDLSAMVDLDSDGIKDIGWDVARDPATGAVIPAGTTPVQEAWYDGVPDTNPPAGSLKRAIAFNGYGKVRLRLDPNLVLPDGLAAPMTIAPLRHTYLEGRFAIAAP